jgi:DNA-binding transcriptional ArsR family regulator
MGKNKPDDQQKKSIKARLFKTFARSNGRSKISALEIPARSIDGGGLIHEEVMSTLTIIAAKQPITMSNLKKIRPVAEAHLKELDEMGLVKAVRKGRSKELTTTDKFADMFGFSRDVNQMKWQIKIYLPRR